MSGAGGGRRQPSRQLIGRKPVNKMAQYPCLQTVQVDETRGYGTGRAVRKPVQGVGDPPDEDNFRDLRPFRHTRLRTAETEPLPHDTGYRNIAGKIP